MANQPAKPIKEKSAKSDFSKDRFSLAPIAWSVGFLTLLVVSVAAWLAAQATVTAAERAVEGIGNAATTLVSGFGQAMLQSIELVLTEGDEQQRLDLLNQLADCEFSESSELPAGLVSAIEKNLEDENEEISCAADRIIKKLNLDLGSEAVSTGVESTSSEL